MDNNYDVEKVREEKEILEKILGLENIDIEQMKIIYIKKILTSEDNQWHYNNGINDENIDTIIAEIKKLIVDTKSSVLEFKNLYPGKPVFELGNKVIKFNRDFRIPHSQHILAPEIKIKYGQGMAMTVFEKLDTRGVVKVSDDADQIMYNRLREEGWIWLDVHMVNIGVTQNRRDENDDGLRVIDADKIYDYYQLLNSMEPMQDQYGVPSKQKALNVYLGDRGYLRREEAYLNFKRKQEEERKQQKKITPTEIANAGIKSMQSKPGTLSESLRKVQKIFSRVFNRNDTKEK